MHLKAVALSLTVISVLSISSSQPSLARKSTKSAAASHTVNTSDEEAVRAQLKAMENAVASGDAKSMTSLWTEDGRYVDDEGQLSVGHEALEKTFAEAAKENGKPQVSLTPVSIRFPAPQVAVVEGTVKRLVPGSTDGMPVSRYTLTLVKKPAGWLVSAGTEVPIVAKSSSAEKEQNPLDNLSWLIGDWSAERNGGKVHMKAEWVPSKNFILCRYDIYRPNQTHQVETQLIGWDPREHSPISWSFDANGGFGQGSWTRQADQWLIQSTGVTRDGCLTSATNIISSNDPDSFSWQSINRHADGALIADTSPLKIERVRK